MVAPLILCFVVFHCITINYGLRLDESSLMQLLKLPDYMLDGLGFEKLNSTSSKGKTTNPLSSFFLASQDYIKICAKESSENEKSRQHPDIFLYPEFQRVYLDCKKMFTGNSNCLSTCIFYGVIQNENYGKQFIFSIKGQTGFYYNPSIPFPHFSSHDFHFHDNIFCMTKDYRSVLLNNMLKCKIPLPTEFCILDEQEMFCRPHLNNCNYKEEDMAVITVGNNAHPLVCGTLDTVKWDHFDNSSKLQCILPRRKKLFGTQRAIFKNCQLCVHKKGNKLNGAVIEFLTPPTKEEFAKVAYSVRPIIIRNGANYEKMHLLNFTFIKEKYDEYLVDHKMECQFNPFHSPFDNFEHFLSLVSDEKMLDFDWYASWQLCNPTIRQKFQSIIPKPRFLPDDYPTPLDPWLFTGTDGVHPHIDYIRRQTWQAQLSGSKTWILRAPPECYHMCRQWFPVKVNQGDLFIAETSTWFHGTEVEEGTMSIVISTDFQG